MKTLIVTILVSLSFTAQARTITPKQMNPEQQAQLIDVLNQLEPEMLDTILSEEALDWYISQFSRSSGRNNMDEQSLEIIHGRADIGYDAFADENAPTFN